MKNTMMSLLLAVAVIGSARSANAEVRRLVLLPTAHGSVFKTLGAMGNPDSYGLYAGSNVLAQTILGSYGYNQEHKGYAVYDTGGIPDNARILQVNLFYDSGYMNSTTFRALGGNPEQEANATNAWLLVAENPNQYYYGADLDFIEGPNQRHAMIGPLVSGLQASLAGNSFAFSVSGGPTVFTALKLEVFYSTAAVASSYSTLSVAGPFGFWNPRSHPLALIAPHVWRGSYPISDSNLTFKFVADADWQVANWGDSNVLAALPHEGAAVAAGPDIVYNQPFAGRAVFTFDEQTLAYRVEAYATDYSSISVAGTFNDWNPGANRLELISNRVWQGTVFLLTNNAQFKFVANDDFGANNWGEAAVVSTFPHTGTGVVFGADIQLGAWFSAGDHRFTFDESSGRYTVEKLPAGAAGGISVAGTFNGWDPGANPMTETAPGVWTGSIVLPAGDVSFKFVVGASWEVGDFGDADPADREMPISGTPDFRGGDIVVSNAVAGAHAFELNLNACTYEVRADGNGAPARPVLGGIDRISGSQIVVRWSSESNRTYRILSSTNLLTGFDATVQSGIPASWPQNIATAVVDGAGFRMFRVERE